MKTTEEINEKAEEYNLTNGVFGFKEGIKFVKPESKKEIYEEVINLAYIMEDKFDYEETEEGKNWSFIIAQLQSLKLL
jgi:hypothetical protein